MPGHVCRAGVVRASIRPFCKGDGRAARDIHRPSPRTTGAWQQAANLTITTGVERLFMQIIVRDNNVDQALRALKKKLQREGVYREMKLRRHYEKPSEKRARERAAAIRRARKMERKRVEREGAR
jgi:small subunit ribosomal protein S21